VAIAACISITGILGENVWGLRTEVIGTRVTVTPHTKFSLTAITEHGYTMAAEVGLLTRNVKIIGEEYGNMDKQSFGGRILVSDFFDGAQQWTGRLSAMSISQRNLRI